MTLDPSTLPPTYLSAVSSAAATNMGIAAATNGIHQRPPMASVASTGHGHHHPAAAMASPSSAFALMGAHQQHQLLQVA